MNSRTVLKVLLLLLALGGMWLTRQAPPVPAPVPVQVDIPAATAPAASAAPAAVILTGVGFRDRSHLTEHFEKQGTEVGRISVEEYLRAAQLLRDRPAGGDVLESVRADGVVTRFDRASRAFLAFDRDGSIRTFFRPNAGDAYYAPPLRRAPHTP